MAREATEAPDWTALRNPSLVRSPLGATRDIVQQRSAALRVAGAAAADKLAETFAPKTEVLVVGGPTDFEGYAGGLASRLVAKEFDVRIACLWMDASRLFSSERSEIRQVMRSFIDEGYSASSELVIAYNVIGDVASATTAMLWAAHKSPAARLSITTALIERANLREILEEASVCFGSAPEYEIQTIADLKGEFILHHPYPDIYWTKDNVSYVPPLVQQRMIIPAESPRPLK